MEKNEDTPNSPDSPEGGLPALSPRRLAARRANAQKSTGPRTPEGKAVVSLNALKHGFFAFDTVNPVLDGSARVEQFNSILDALLEDFQPRSARERILVEEVAACCWRVRRLLRYECRASWSDEDAYRRWATTEKPSDALLTSMGYDNSGDRRRKAEKLRRAGLDAFILPNDSGIDKIVRFERSVKRNLFRALKWLERIQASRNTPTSFDESSPTRQA